MIKKILVMATMMSIIAGTFIAIMTYGSIGFSDNFFSRWSSSLLYSLFVMMPLGGILIFIANKVVKVSFPNLKKIIQNILIGILIALFMEAIMATITTINIIGYINLHSFLSSWLKLYLLTLPFALVFSPIMTILIKPKIEAYLKN